MSTRISKTLAEDVAENLLQPKKDELNLLKKKLIENAEKLAVDTISSELKEAFLKYKSYFHTTNKIRLYFESDYLEIIGSNYFPNASNAYRFVVNVNKDVFQSMSDLQELIDRKRVEYNKAVDLVSNTIYGLKTPLQVQKHFPEAYELLPKETNGSMLPMVNLDQVRALVQ